MKFEEELAELQDELAEADYAEAIRQMSDRDRIFSYLLLKKILPIKIRMDGNKNHKRPHVHIDYGTKFHAASYAIDTGKRIAGDSRYDKEVCPWITRHRAKLFQAWQLMQAGKDAEPIACELRGEE